MQTQFGLRTLLAAVAIIGWCLGYVHQHRRAETAEAVLARHGLSSERQVILAGHFNAVVRHLVDYDDLKVVVIRLEMNERHLVYSDRGLFTSRDSG